MKVKAYQVPAECAEPNFELIADGYEPRVARYKARTTAA